MAGRSLRLTSRKLDALVTSLLLPVLLMLMFVYLFGGAIHTGTAYHDYVVPGVLLLCSVSARRYRPEGQRGHDRRHHRPVPVHGHQRSRGAVRPRGGQPGPERHLDRPGLRVGFGIGFRPDARRPGSPRAGILLAFVLAVSWLSAASGWWLGP